MLDPHNNPVAGNKMEITKLNQFFTMIMEMVFLR